MLTLGRSTTPAVDFDAPPSIAEAAHSLFTQGPWNLVLVATGMLQGPTGKPEKRLTDLSAEHMAASFAVNTIGPALALAHFAPQLAHGERSVLAPRRFVWIPTPTIGEPLITPDPRRTSMPSAHIPEP